MTIRSACAVLLAGVFLFLLSGCGGSEGDYLPMAAEEVESLEISWGSVDVLRTKTITEPEAISQVLEAVNQMTEKGAYDAGDPFNIVLGSSSFPMIFHLKDGSQVRCVYLDYGAGRGAYQDDGRSILVSGLDMQALWTELPGAERDGGLITDTGVQGFLAEEPAL